MDLKNNKKLKPLDDYVIDDGLSIDYISAEKFHKKLMALRKKYKKEEGMSKKIDQLKQWVKEELVDIRFNEFKNIMEVILDEEESNVDSIGGFYEFRFKFNVYTETHCYRVSALDRSKNEGHLGCSASVRKPRAGEDWNRGNDLADGPFTKETWQKIKNSIIAYELVKLAPKIGDERSGKREIKLDESDESDKSIIGGKDSEKVDPNMGL